MSRTWGLRPSVAGTVGVLLSGCAWWPLAPSPTEPATNHTAPASPGVLPLRSGLLPASYGEPFTVQGLFQGCDIVDGVDYCAFHVEGWKYYAYRDGPTPTVVLNQLEQLPLNTAVVIEGDQINVGDITVEFALRALRADPAGDVYARVRRALQGRWVSLDDPQSEIEIIGSEMRSLYAGQFLGQMFLRIASQCDDAPDGAGPLLISIDPENREDSQCFAILQASADTLRLTYLGRGTELHYRRWVGS